MKYETDFPITYVKQYHLSDEITITPETFDIIYVLSGKINISSAADINRIYSGNNITTLHSHTRYQISPAGSNVILHFGLKTDFIEKYIGPDHYIICDSISEPNRDYLLIKKLLSSIAAQYLDNCADHQLSILGQLFQLIDLFSKEYVLMLPAKTADINPKYKERMYKTQEYISQNYNQPITLNSVAAAVHLTPQYFSKFFKKYFSVNFNEYVNMIRLQHALRDIRYTKLGITEIAINHGFQNISTFNRRFRDNYGSSPRDYRKCFLQQTIIEHKWPQEIFAESNLITNTALGTRNITVNVGDFTPFSHNFSNLINVGSAQLFLLDSFKGHFLTAHKELHFKYVRVEGLISNALVPRLVTSNTFYFANIVEILEFYKENNLIPFIELGKNSYDYQLSFSHPVDFRSYSSKPKFHAMLKAFLKFVTERYSLLWIEHWIFELWHPPGESITEYMDAYQTIEQIIHTYIPTAAFGGPGYNTALPASDFPDYLHAFKSRKIVPDFISIHLFAIQHTRGTDSDRLILSAVNDSLLKEQKWTMQIEDILGTKIPLYITEFNSTLIPQTFINDSCYQATFLCRNLLDLHEDYPLIGYWTLSNITFSITGPSTYMINGVSLINQNGIKMPSYHAYSLLNKLGTSLIEKGDNFCITKGSENNYHVFAYHYARLTNYQSLLENENRSLLGAYAYYEETPSVEMSFHLTGLPTGIYRVKRYLLDRFHGSLLDIHLGGLNVSTIDENTYLNKIQSPSPQLTQYLSATCVPEERIIYLDIQNELNIKTTLAPHNICLWEIVKEL